MGNRILTEEEYNELKKDRDNWRDWFYELRYALRKDEQLDESISCVRDIPSDVEMIEDLKKRATDGDYYKDMSELLKEKLKKANELADSWKRDYERLRDQFIYPIYNILYPDKPDLDINVTDLLKDVKDLKIYAKENERIFKELQEWREKCIARGYEIGKLQNIVTEKVVEIKKLKTEIAHLVFDRATVKDIIKKNSKLNQTISDQEVTIKALLITIKEMCKEDETNEWNPLNELRIFVNNKRGGIDMNDIEREYSDEFDKMRKSRVYVSYHKYGPARKNFGEGRVDAIGSLELCLEKFKKTKNTEYLLDVANYAMFRYMFPMPGEFFKATDSSESAGTVGTPVNME